ncbi:vacuolar amino acid transporter 1-like protein [Tanacetum coccineum]
MSESSEDANPIMDAGVVDFSASLEVNLKGEPSQSSVEGEFSSFAPPSNLPTSSTQSQLSSKTSTFITQSVPTPLSSSHQPHDRFSLPTLKLQGSSLEDEEFETISLLSKQRSQSLTSPKHQRTNIEGDSSESSPFLPFHSPLSTFSSSTTPPSFTTRLPNALEVERTIVPLPILSWKRKVELIIIGVYMFCSPSLWSTPFALNECGWSGLLILGIFLAMSLFTAFLIPSCIHNLSNATTFSDIGDLAFGRRGELALLIANGIFCYATCIDSIMLTHGTLGVPLEAHPYVAGMLTVSMLLVLGAILTQWNVNENSPRWNGIGVLLTILVVICLVFVGIFDTGFKGSNKTFFTSSTLHKSIGFFSFCFCGHSVLAHIFSVVKDRREYDKLVRIIFLISFALYTITACIGYSMFGIITEAYFTLNVGTKSAASQLVIWLTVFNQCVRYILNLTPTALAVGQILPQHLRNQVKIRWGLVATTALTIGLTPYYGSLVSLFGSIVGVTMSLLIPSICYLRINMADLSIFKGIFSVFALLLGIFAMFFVAYRSITSLVSG